MPLPETSWEWRLGEFLKSHSSQNVFADISYFSEVLTANAEIRTSLAAVFRRWLTEFDPGCDHILFGSDWIMLDKEAGYSHYIESINSFLRTECRLSDDACDKIFRRNATRFLSLADGSPGRDRLLAYYRRNGLDETRLPSMRPPLGYWDVSNNCHRGQANRRSHSVAYRFLSCDWPILRTSSAIESVWHN